MRVQPVSYTHLITEALKAENQLLWVQQMNNVQNVASEIVLNELIYC